MTQQSPNLSRRNFLSLAARAGTTLALGGILGTLIAQQRAAATQGTVWQLDPAKCIQCGKCATACVLHVSAVRCFHTYAICGYCDLCTGYFEPDAPNLTTAAENQLCPTAAIKRTFIEDPYFEYSIDRDACIGCSKCVKGCRAFGNGSLHLQIDHSVCKNCNVCAIAKACPADAFSRVPASSPYIENKIRTA